MPNQKQFDTTLQSIRNIDCKLFVLDYDYTVIDEISGKTESVSLSVDAESDIRRTAVSYTHLTLPTIYSV